MNVNMEEIMFEDNRLRGMLADLRATIARLTAELAARTEELSKMRGDPTTSQHPKFCPITLRPFFMVIEHEELGMVATYGGPFDNYTIPEWNPEDKDFRSERYDHDCGFWIEGGEPYPFELADSSDLLEQDDHAKELARQLAAVKTELDGLAAWMNMQSHANQCSSLANGKCDCWKARMTPDVYVARILSRGYAAGLRQAAEHCRATDLLMPLQPIGITYRAYGANVCLAMADELDRMAHGGENAAE